LHRKVSGLLHRFHREIAGRLDDDRSLAAHPGDNGRPVFVVMPSTGLALLAAPPRAASQRFLPAVWRLPLLARRVIEGIGFDRAFQLTMHLIGQRGIPEPPAPAIACADMDPHLPGNASRRAGETQQKGRQNPERERPLALMEQGVGEIVEGALAAVTPVAFAPGAIVVRPPRINVLALTPGPL